MPWIRRQLRGNSVFVKSDESGQPAPGPDGRVEVIYKMAPDAKVYRASVKNLDEAAPNDDEVLPDMPEAAAPDAPPASAAPDDAIIVYTDGACTGNPGPMGLGAVIMDGDNRLELSEFLGQGTNNIAELTAILRALQSIEDRGRTVLVHSDSAYSIGLLTKNWKAKANQELVRELRALVAAFTDLRFVKVKAHVGIEENERCDQLANEAIARDG